MKNTHKLSAALLVAVAGAAIVVPSATKAEQSDWKTEGVVEFEKDTSLPTVKEPDGTTVIPEISVNPGATNELAIVAATPLDFEKHAILSDGSSEPYNVKPYGSSVGTYEHFVDFKDVRSTTTRQYHIFGKLSKQFTHNDPSATGNATLAGATITYSNLRIAGDGRDTTTDLNMPEDSGFVKGKSITLAEGQQELFYSMTNAARGYGQYKIAFGNRANGEDEIRKSVQLAVPGDVVKFKGQYTAEITWTIADTPTPTNP
ncbi:WxL domain-containing protein [Enterococcus sp. BWR-S5]|uniref:WxL domain-containing protein n=1 Tax=Enterococcus sp. BWR-S5 TaxID=2787714 RepID=UPI0019238A76|nr:WxL domain-containing protein [Enterococcus sp. BWR-S5]MBL1226622.1 WxL domain-containing protein [Enterococcus sp. BWR-S5]